MVTVRDAGTRTAHITSCETNCNTLMHETRTLKAGLKENKFNQHFKKNVAAVFFILRAMAWPFQFQFHLQPRR
jgi:hypothetical protein